MDTQESFAAWVDHGETYEMTSCSSVKLKTCQLLISGIFHIIFWPWLTVGNRDWATQDHRHSDNSDCAQNSNQRQPPSLSAGPSPRPQISGLSLQSSWAAMACAPALPDGPRCQRLHCHKTEQASLSKHHCSRRCQVLGKTTSIFFVSLVPSLLLLGCLSSQLLQVWLILDSGLHFPHF